MREYREMMAQQRSKEVRMRLLGIVIFFVLCIGAALIAQALLPPTPTLAPSVTSTVIVATLPPTTAPAAVILPTTAPASLATNTPAPLPTNTPIPTDTPVPGETPEPSPTNTDTATPTITPSPTSKASPIPVPSSDAQADVVTYEGLAPAAQIPAGVDIRAASVAPNLRVALQTAQEPPAELSGWAEGEVVLWLDLYDPIPDPPTVYTEWLFVLDLDGDTATGRPVGSLRINPDLGVEVAVGAFYDPATAEYSYYSLVWDPAQGNWSDGPGGIHFTFSESRTLVGLALPLETLTQSAAQVTGVTLVPSAVRGRAAVLATVDGQRIIDFYPDRP